MAAQTIESSTNRSSWKDYLPFTNWLLNYRLDDLSGDIIAGIVVAVMLVPQSMAYALLAGLPPHMGLYASIVPLVIYGLLGTSRALAVGPVAMVSLLVASGIAGLQPATTAEYVALAITLAFLVGVFQFLMGVFKVGFLVNFLSHPVLSGFTSAAALVIGFSQLKHILGFSIPRSEHLHETVFFAARNIAQTNPVVLGLGTAGIGILLYFKFALGKQLKAIGISETIVTPLTKIGPLVIVILGIVVVSAFGLDESAGVSIIGAVPRGLPTLTLPLFDLDVLQQLLPIALTISLVSYMESISIAKSLASKKRQKVGANQELIALGAANLGATFTGGYPVTGGFGRSMVNFTAGANTGLASILTAGLVALTVIFLTPLFHYLPNAILAAIIVVAVASLVEADKFFETWHYSKADAISWLVTFIAVLELGIETGILLGVVLSLILYLWRTSRPHVAIVGRIEGTEEYRNISRHETVTIPHILAMRVDESLYFPNTQYLEDIVLSEIADHPKITAFVLVCKAVNFIDASALETLEDLHHRLSDNKIGFYFSEVKGPVMDRLQRVGFVDQIGSDHFFLTTHQACEYLQ
jgi:SulP family sulfate permease